MMRTTALSLIRESGTCGMLGVDKIGEIRRAHCREGRSIKGISRPPGVSRATFRKVLWTGATEFVYERRTQPGSKIGGSRSLRGC